MSKKTNQLISRPLPKNAIVTKSKAPMTSCVRKFVKKKGCYCMVIRRGREIEYIELGKALQKEIQIPQTPRCSDCGCDLKNFTHERCSTSK